MTGQKWTLNTSGQIVSTLNPNLCLDVSSGLSANGTNVQTFTCNGTNAQWWGI